MREMNARDFFCPGKKKEKTPSLWENAGPEMNYEEEEEERGGC